MTIQRRFFGVLLPMLSVLFSFMQTPVHAATITTGYSATPQQIVLQANPGESKPISIHLVNLRKDISVVLSAVTRNFTPNPDGTPNVTADQNNPSGITGWLQGPETITLSPGINDMYNATVNVPKNAKTGAYYGVEIFGNRDNKDEPVCGVIVIANVGQTQNSAVVDSVVTTGLQINQQWKAAGQIDVHVKNTGNGYFEPEKLVIELLDANKNTVTSLTADTSTGVLPGATRAFSTPISKLLTPNQKYFARASLYVSAGSKPSVVEQELATPTIIATTKIPAKASPASKAKPNTFLFAGAGTLAILVILLAIFIEHDQHKKHAQLRESQHKLKLLSEHAPAATPPLPPQPPASGTPSDTEA